MKINNTDIIVREIEKPENNDVIIITHVRPDGDTLGSAYALKRAILNRFADKKVNIICGEEIKDRLIFICGGDIPLITGNCEHDLIIAVDIAEPVLMGDNRKFADNKKINIKIDHHPNSSLYADMNYIDETVSSCGEIIYDICKKLGKITYDIAFPLYAAICSDTGNYRYSNVTANTHRITADLIDAGIDASFISNKLYGKKTQKEIISHRLVLNNLQYYQNGKIAVAMITNEMKTNNGITDDDFGDISSIPLDIEDVDLGITIKQFDDKPDKYRVSMRSSENIDASEVCKKLGGGGHVRAAGTLVKADDPESALDLIINAAVSAYE